MYSGIFKMDHLIGDFLPGQNPYPESVRLLYNFLSNEELARAVKTELNLPVTPPKAKEEVEVDPTDPTSDW